MGLCDGSSLKPRLNTSSSSGLQGGEGGGCIAAPIYKEKQNMKSSFTLLTTKDNCSPKREKAWKEKVLSFGSVHCT